jgi:pyruvate kinase
MAVEWGVHPMLIPEAADVEELWARSLDAARETGLAVSGDRVVLTAGTAVNVAGGTNVIRVEIV